MNETGGFEIFRLIYTLLAHTALILGGITWFLSRKNGSDYGELLPKIALPLAIFGVYMIYTFGMEAFIAYYGANQYEVDAFQERTLIGPYRFYYWFLIISHLSTQVFWLPKCRKSAVALFIVGLLTTLAIGF